MKIIEIPIDGLFTNWKAYNCSIVECYGKTWLLYRFEKPYGDFNTEIAITELDSNFQPIHGTSSKLDVVRFGSKVTTFDDPRAFVYEGNLLFTYVCGTLLPLRQSGYGWSNHLCIASWKEGRITKQWLPDFGKNINVSTGKNSLFASEKNWSPFIYNKNIHFVYQINPLTVIEMDIVDGSCRQVGASTSFNQNFWSKKYGNFLGGGTPFLPYGDEYISFFHAFTDNKKKEANSRNYNFGLVAISNKEPFKVTRISKEPLMIAKPDPKKDLRGNSPWLPVCVYPCGFIMRNNKFYVSYGWGDCRCEMAEFSWKEIEKNLVKVKSN